LWVSHEPDILLQLDADPGRGLYVAGTVVGMAGLVAVGASYFFGFTDVLNPLAHSIALISLSLDDAATYIIGNALSSAHASKINRAWHSLPTF